MFILLAFLLPGLAASERFSVSLGGVWKFKVSPPDQPKVGFDEKWWNNDFSLDSNAMDMPVPSSYNDISTDPAVRDFLGWAWYQRYIRLPPFKKYEVTLHFGSAQYFTRVWVNSELVGEHEGGHIPFEFPISKYLDNREAISVTVAVNNTLNRHTIPQGSLTFHEDNEQDPSHLKNFVDFNEWGEEKVDEHGKEKHGRANAIVTANIFWSVWVDNVEYLDKPSSFFRLTDPFGDVILYSGFDPIKRHAVQLPIENPFLWWPRSTLLRHKQPGMMYTLDVILEDELEEVDSLRKKFGIRSVITQGTSIQLNGMPVYLKGFGMHQDAEIRGRGFDPVHLVRDMNLLKWAGANAIRTSHYPYYEEFLEMTDRFGIMVILETPACSLSIFDDALLNRHKEVLTEMWNLFKDHPSVIMWSLANEPQSNDGNSTLYFQELVHLIKTLDPNRLVTFVTSQQIENEKAIQSVDVICVNRYQGWYSLGGRLDLVRQHVIQEMENWSKAYGKPVITTEYGAEALAGYHALPSTMWTENYQIDLLHEHFEAFDSLRLDGVLSGEMVWNFADFKVPQEYFRAELCDKGVFTRNRQPKGAAYTIKLRYENLLLGTSPEPVVLAH